MPVSHFGTCTFLLIFTATSVMAEVQMKSQTITPPTMKTQEAVAAPVAPPAPASGTAGTPLVFATPANTAAAQEAKKQEAKKNQDMLNLINQMMGGGAGSGVGIGPGNGPNGSSIDPNAKFESMNQQIGPGIMEACGDPPASAHEAFETAKNFRQKCSLANRGDNQKIAVNDYSTIRMPYMYIFDIHGNCLGKTAVTYGNGAGPVRPQPCNDDGSHLTPPGFFLTAEHNGASYGPGNSLGLVGLEGQGAKGRGVVIHPAQAPGTASSWGCSGVGYGAFRAVQKSLGKGALVFNYFGNTGRPGGCTNINGLNPAHNFCRLDPGAPGIPQMSTSQGAPTLR